MEVANRIPLKLSDAVRVTCLTLQLVSQNRDRRPPDADAMVNTTAPDVARLRHIAWQASSCRSVAAADYDYLLACVEAAGLSSAMTSRPLFPLPN